MSFRTLELLDLVARWVHVIAGIMWIGNSLLFNWLDRVLQPSPRGGEGKQGQTWLIHSGGFYFLEKTLLIGQPLPRPLHWFKWQAYTTWLSGAVLLIVTYYVGGRAILVDEARPEFAPGMATAIGAGSVIATWVVYDAVWRVVGRKSAAIAGAISLLGLLALTWLLTHMLSGRAAFIHVGAALGTIMAGNVAMSIMPSQRVLVESVRHGRGSDPVVAEQAKTRSIHNNYLTFPVIVLMLSSHFPSMYGYRLSWILLLVLIGAGAAVRHVLNVRFTLPHWKPALAATITASLVALYGLTRSGDVSGDTASSLQGVPLQPTFGDVQRVIDRRCAACHSARPSDLSFGPAPGGIAFDTPEQVQRVAPRIRERAVVTRTMPPGNKTRMTDAERELLARWLSSVP